MFKVLSSFSVSIFLGLKVKDWNVSGLASRKLLNITAVQNYLNWRLIRDALGQVNVVFSLTFLKPIL